MKEKKGKKRTTWRGQVLFKNGWFRSGTIKNNKPKHDCITIEFRKDTPHGKSVSFQQERWDLTLDEAVATAFLLNKAILLYLLKSKHNIRLWEYENLTKTLRIVEKKGVDK